MSSGNRRTGQRVAVAGVVILAVAGCASISATAPDARLADELKLRGVNPAEVVLPFETTASMRRWARHVTASAVDDERRLDALLDALLDPERGGMIYEDGTTATAHEVWRSKRANCLSFAHLFTGLARELGLPVYYLRILDVEGFEKDGDLVIASKHVAVGYGPPSKRRVIEFTDRPVKPQREIVPVSDLTATALYYSDLGAQRIRERRSAEAKELLDVAVRLAPDLGETWVNLGVALRRLDRLDEAETAFRRALDADPRLVPAYNNLAALLESRGRTAEARTLLEQTDHARNRNPFSYLALGDLSLREGRLADAERFFQRAHRYDPQRPEPLAGLGQCALAAGRRAEAERWLAKAAAIDPANARAIALARALEEASKPRL